MKCIRRNFFRYLGTAILFGVAMFLAGCQSELYSNLSEQDANEMIQVLQDAGIDAVRSGSVEGAFSIKVDSGDFSIAVSKLAERGLPREKFGSLGEVFQGNKLVSTPFEERARFMHAMNQELENSISRISGIVSARVHLIVPEDKPFAKDKEAPRASVFIYKNPDANLEDILPTIKNLIVNSLDGLTYDNVEVAIFNSARVTDQDKTSPQNSNKSMLIRVIILGVLCAIIIAGITLLAYLRNHERERRNSGQRGGNGHNAAIVPGE